jgi:hypothetical protein
VGSWNSILCIAACCEKYVVRLTTPTPRLGFYVLHTLAVQCMLSLLLSVVFALRTEHATGT